MQSVPKKEFCLCNLSPLPMQSVPKTCCNILIIKPPRTLTRKLQFFLNKKFHPKGLFRELGGT